MAKVFLALGLVLFLASLGAVFCPDVGQEIGRPGGRLSRSKRSPDGHKPCPCPGTHGPQKQERHRWACPCDDIPLSVPEQPRRRHHHHHHGGKTKRHLHHKKKQCQRFLRHCHLRQVNIPL
ncbi:C-X-C motif chemokine 17-like isoform X2 [Sceloporus undulatus]|uniref:C-X-C motif chemokine 17-like isoform X2 n=1 Tax=Sceloporus undulatus TaxID=8520 RepID=UPI001C4B21BD|nr:C-X-C motif chemokine 17-like isoform X2 [Sceloporus undulatus]